MDHYFRIPAAQFLWSVFLLVCFASQVVAQNTPATPEPNSLPNETASSPQRTQPKVIVIETTPDIDRSEVIRQVVEALEKNGRAKRSDIERVGESTALEAIVSPVLDMPQEKVVKLIDVLQSLGVDRMRFIANNEQTESTVIIQCPANVTWRKVRTMTEELEKTGDFKVDVRVAASDERVTPVAVESLPNANRVQPTLPGAEELPPPSNPQDGFSPFTSRPAPETSERGELKVFALQNIQAKEAGRIIEQLYMTTPSGRDSIAIRLSVDDRNNSLIVRGDSAVIAEVEALLLRLDTKQPETDPVNSSNAIGGDGTGIRVNVPALGPEPLAVDFAMPGGGAKGKTYSFYIGIDGQSADDLNRQYEALEQQASNLSDELRKPLPDPGKSEELKSQLRDAVKQAFEARQKLQRAELARFAQRMKAIHESIELRDKISQQIIDRRVEELLDPNLKWDDPETSSERMPALRSPSRDSSIGVSSHFGAGHAATSDETQTVQIKFDSRELGKVEWLSGPGSVMVDGFGAGRINVKYGGQIQMRLSEIPGRENAIVFLSLDVSDDSAEEMWRRKVVNPSEVLSHNAIPLEVMSDDLDQVISGNAVTKVIYLPHDRKSAALFETLVSTRLDPNIDIFKAAREKGGVVAIVRISNHPNSETVKSGAESAFKSPVGDATYGGLSQNNPTDTVRDSSRSGDPESRYSPNQDEKAISKLVLTFFQDRSRRAVPCLVVKINEEYFAVTTSPATVVPDGTTHAIDRSVVEWGDGPGMTVTYDERSTKELHLYRFEENAVIPEPLRTAAEIEIEKILLGGFDPRLEIGVALSALTPVGAGLLSETRVRVSAINVSWKLSLPSHQVEHHYDGLFAVDVALPEGTPVFLEGKLMGLTILGSRFVGEEAQRSFVIPASRLWEELRHSNKVTVEPDK